MKKHEVEVSMLEEEKVRLAKVIWINLDSTVQTYKIIIHI